LQLLEWAAEAPRSRAELMEVWKSTCPRLSIREDACADGLVECGEWAGWPDTTRSATVVFRRPDGNSGA
jgi:hypothetical protein